MAKSNNFLCNQHQGGQVVYVGKRDIPKKILEISKKIVAAIKKPQALYALDFLISNSGKVYFVEGNIGPGINWDIEEKDDTRMAKQLIRSIVGEFVNRLKPVLPIPYPFEKPFIPSF